MSSETRHSLRCTRIAGIGAALTSIVTAGLAVPAGAAPPVTRAAASSGRDTPACLVGAALLYPMVLGMVMVMKPAFLPDAATNYWMGGKLGLGQGSFPGFLQQCGLNADAGGS
jgi:hypothetical protein